MANDIKEQFDFRPPSVSVIIPTLNAGSSLGKLLEQLSSQTIRPAQIIIIDSESTDDTRAIAIRNQCTLITISRQKFDHGMARNIATSHADGEFLVFFTQDVECVNEFVITELIQPMMENPQIAVCYGRHLPKSDADPIEHFLRGFNYPPLSRLKTKNDIAESGLTVFFCSNCCSAIRAGLFRELGGFKNSVGVNEDILFAAGAIQKGYGVYYNATAQIYHSHQYSLGQLWKRYYLIGRFFAENQALFGSTRLNSYGQNLFGAAARFFWKRRSPYYIVPFTGQLCLKALACKAGGLHSRFLTSRTAAALDTEKSGLYNYEHSEISK